MAGYVREVVMMAAHFRMELDEPAPIVNQKPAPSPRGPQSAGSMGTVVIVDTGASRVMKGEILPPAAGPEHPEAAQYFELAMRMAESGGRVSLELALLRGMTSAIAPDKR